MLLTIPIWLPLLGVVALVVLLVEGRPLFFRQLRAGLGGRPFNLIKFRTMRIAAPDAVAADELRVTRLGKFLRATSLDELPELFHVLIGTMSLVGPRPLPVEYLPRYSAQQLHRHDVRPGLTGLAQVCGRNSITWEEKFAFDLEYVQHHSLLMDFRIICRTLWQVVASHDGDTPMPEFAPPKGKGD